MTVQAPGVPHPRIAERRADVVAAVRSGERRRRRVLWIGLVVSFALLCGYLATRSELLDVDRIAVTGATRTPAGEILKAAGIDPGQPLIGLDLPGARSRIARLPWVKDVYSTRAWDGRVTFQVTERSPVAAVAIPGAWALTGADGRVLEVTSVLAEEVMPILGLNVVGAAPGEWLAGTHRGALAVAVSLYEPVRSAVRAVEVTPEGYVLDLAVPGRVVLGDSSDIAAKLEAVHTFLAKVNLRCLEVLDVRAAAAPVLTRAIPCR